MIRHLGALIALVAIIFLSRLSFAKVPQAQSAPPRPVQQPQPAEPVQANEDLNQQVIEQIKDIRKRVGGSIAEQFKDLDISESTKQMADQEFERELNRLATQVGPRRPGAPDHPSVISNAGQNASFPQSRPANPVHPPSHQGSTPQPKHTIQAVNSSFSPNYPPNFGPDGPGYPLSRGFIRLGVPPKLPSAKPFTKAGFPVAKPSSSDQLRAAARRLEELAAELEVASLYEEADQIRNQAEKFWLKARKNNSN
jgi:hypothetical protein